MGPTEPASSQLSHLIKQVQQYEMWFRQCIEGQAGQAGEAATWRSPDSNFLDTVATLRGAAAAKSHLSAIKYWAETVRELDRRCRGLVQHGSQLSVQTDQQAYTSAMQSAIEAMGQAYYAADYAAANAHSDLAQLNAAAAVVDARMQECRYGLYSRLNQDASQLLDSFHWPPPLVHIAESPPLQRSSNDPPTTTESTPPPASSPPKSTVQLFSGFDGDSAQLAQLLAVLACMTSLQQAVDRKAFQAATQVPQENGHLQNGEISPGPSHNMRDASQAELPVLWAAMALVAPLQARLQAHFQPHTAAGRLDQPQWLFKLAFQLVQDHAPAMVVLQPALEAAGLGSRTHMVVEWARGMREAVKAVLRTARLPALVQQWEQQPDLSTCLVWRAHVEAMVGWEAQLAPFLGAITHTQESAVLPTALLRGSVLGAITDDPTNMGVWLAAEQHSALQRLQAITQSSTAWQPSEEAENGTEDFVSGGWHREFNAPRLAEEVADLVAGLVDLSQHLPTADAQRELLDVVGGTLLMAVRKQLITTLEQAAQYQGITSAAGAPQASACVAAARYLHHTLSEQLAGPALHRLQSEPSGHQGQDWHGPHGQDQKSFSSPGPSSYPQSPGAKVTPTKGVMDEVVVRHSFAPVAHNPPVLAAAVAGMGALHRDWCLRVARELALDFGRSATGYRTAVEKARQYPTHGGAAGTVTPELVPALTMLQEGLRAVSGALDGPALRDIWRAVAVPVNRFMFNYVATEASFTAAGAEQFAVDCTSVVAVLAPYTKRPAAHFKEMLAAARLLTLSDDQAGEAVRRASGMAVQGQPLWRDSWLAELGVGCLGPHQVLAVVERRV